MRPGTAAAVSHPNIALIKYWGNRDAVRRLPSNGSISMTLAGLETHASIALEEGLLDDVLQINGQATTEGQTRRVTGLLDHIRKAAGRSEPALISSGSNFPSGAGIASSASAFAAITVAAAAAYELNLSPPELSALARLGSGSACRSIYGGYVEWSTEGGYDDSAARPLYPPEHWRLVDLIAIISREHKPVGSTEGHALAETSPLQTARVQDTPRRLTLCRQALQDRDFEALASIVELDSNLMHAVMMTSSPSLLYWAPASLRLMKDITAWRRSGIAVCYTLDAGPSVHALCLPEDAAEVERRLRSTDGVLEVHRGEPGQGARPV